MTFKISGNLVLPNKVIQGSLSVENGKIAKIEESSLKKSSNYILPGLIEVHGHLREPGMTQKGDVPHETRAALSGGFTTIIDMPNTNPPTTTVALLKDKINKIYPSRSYADYAFFMGASRDSLTELEKVERSQIVGVKIFMAGHETTPTTIPDDETLDKIANILGKKKILLAVHAEDQNLINKLNEKFKKTGRTDPALWSEIRPKEVVIKAVERAIKAASKHRAKLYLLHLSTPEEFALVKKAKRNGLNVFGELVGYQLIFNINDYKKFGNKIKVAPALRNPKDQDALWKLFKNKQVDVVCSEHTPHEWETKKQKDMWKAQAGTPGIQETLPALITYWNKRYKDLEEGLKTIAKLASENPAKIFGFTSKGSLEIGKDADFVVIDTKQTWTVQKKDLFSKCGWSAYEGMKLIGRPVATYLRGSLVYKDGKILGKPQGKWVNR